MKSFLAIDIGASSGRHIIGYIEENKLKLQEIHRFDNGFKEENGSLAWDIDRLEKEVIAGILRCKEQGFTPESISIDTWGVDYVLLDENKDVLYPVYCYRDGSTAKAVEESEKLLPFSALYEKTGIQKQSFNTVYQLFRDKQSGKLDNARHFMMIPDYLIYRLTGNMFNEYTNATTGGLVNALTCEWDKDIIDALGLPEKLFLPLSHPGTFAGSLKPEIAEKAGFDSKVVLCASHDTGSAVAACPMQGENVYISSGTWSLIGVESLTPILTKEAYKANFTNEGGVEKRFRFLKNYMGMWLLQSIRRDLNKKYTYDEMMEMAESSKGEVTYIDVNSPFLVSPVSMIEAVKECAGKPDMPLDEVINCVYHSLAQSYSLAIREIEGLTGRRIEGVSIVGGGGSDLYLNRLTSQYTGLPVSVGAKEATAVGNLTVQIMADDKSITLKKMREIILNSFV